MIFNQKWTKCANFDKLKSLHDLQHTTASKYVQISTYLVQVVICFVSWRCLIQINDLEEVPFDHHFIKKLTRFSCTAVSKKHKIWKAKKNSRKYLQSPICSKMQTYWKTKRENFRTRNQWRQWMLECPMLWRITKHSLHNEGIFT